MTEIRSIVSVVFINDTYKHGHKTYDYYTPFNADTIEPNEQYVVVDSPYSGYTLARVVAVREATSHNGTMKPIVDIVNYSWYKKEKEQAQRKVQIIKELDKKAKEAAKRASYETLLKDDPEAQKLLDELKKL